MIEAYNREVQGLDDVEIWIHTCWGNPNMQRVDTASYATSIELYLERLKGDVWTVETTRTTLPRSSCSSRSRTTSRRRSHRRGEPPHAPGRPAPDVAGGSAAR